MRGKRGLPSHFSPVKTFLKAPPNFARLTLSFLKEKGEGGRGTERRKVLSKGKKSRKERIERFQSPQREEEEEEEGQSLKYSPQKEDGRKRLSLRADINLEKEKDATQTRKMGVGISAGSREGGGRTPPLNRVAAICDILSFREPSGYYCLEVVHRSY